MAAVARDLTQPSASRDAPGVSCEPAAFLVPPLLFSFAWKKTKIIYYAPVLCVFRVLLGNATSGPSQQQPCWGQTGPAGAVFSGSSLPRGRDGKRSSLSPPCLNEDMSLLWSALGAPDPPQCLTAQLMGGSHPCCDFQENWGQSTETDPTDGPGSPPSSAA